MQNRDSMDPDVHPMKRPYFERWLSNRDGFVRIMSGSIDFVGIEEVVRMGPFYDIYCLVVNDSIFDTDDNAHKLLYAAPYYTLSNGKVINMGWSGGVIANMLAKDALLSKDLARNIMKEELKSIMIKSSKLLLRHRNTDMGPGWPYVSLPCNRPDRI